jgi:hypothetical protein
VHSGPHPECSRREPVTELTVRGSFIFRRLRKLRASTPKALTVPTRSVTINPSAQRWVFLVAQSLQLLLSVSESRALAHTGLPLGSTAGNLEDPGPTHASSASVVRDPTDLLVGDREVRNASAAQA